MKAKTVIIGTIMGHPDLMRLKTNRKISSKGFGYVARFPLKDVKVVKKIDL